jgi:cytochrome c biogenesis protein CcdA/thiol-disulfide isomerase/thioredoxin
MTLLFIAFVAGLLTVLAPCTLPLLPVIVGGSVSGERHRIRAYVIAGSLSASIFIFTLALKASTALISVPSSFWQWVSGGLLLGFGLVTVFPEIWERLSFTNKINLSSNRLLAKGYTRGDIFGDILVGAALGPIFSSCSPTYFIVLATVLPVHPAEGVVYLFAYCVGLALSLLGISVAGQKVVDKLGFASDPSGWFKRSVGVIFMLIGLSVVTGYNQTLESELLSHAGMFDVTQIEEALLLGRAPGTTLGTSSTGVPDGTSKSPYLSLDEKRSRYQKAPELSGIDGYLNTAGKPISLSELKGNVVLIDFWTYSCINCLRTIPFLNAWYEKYKDKGFVIIGVHTPEFAFEHLERNVADAITRLGIRYPVVLDNEYATWNAFGNQFWPREYLVDIDGYVVHDHSGEGEYDVTEKAIQEALNERAARFGMPATIASSTVRIAPADLSGIGSPETYFGSDRNEYLGNGTPGVSGNQSFTFPTSISRNALYLDGAWDIEPEYADSLGTTSMRFSYSARDVDFVASASTPVTIEVLRDGKPLGAASGSDVDRKTSTATIGADRLYNLIHDATPGVHLIQINVRGAGLKAYTFTFG